MRAAHEWDEELRLCVRCGAKRDAATPPAAPSRPPERPIVAPGAADGLRRAAGGRRKPTREQAAAFVGQGPTRETPARVAAPPLGFGALPDPTAAAVAALELERDELDSAISVLKRLQARQAARG